ncbi:MAG: T6SS immunity protein Tli4 family protein [Pseudomonadota bacterium]|nr:T6SS immunity protein Tli4 family protein [Pseudomonadota bacterium]
MKTVCVGRFLIDVPVNAQVTIGSAAIAGLDIVQYGKESLEQFTDRTSRREEEINAEKNRAGQKNMDSIQEFQHNDVHGKIFVFNREASYYLSNGKRVATLTVAINSYAHVNGMSLGFRTSVYRPEDIAGLARFLEQLQPIEDGKLPTQSGFCLDRVLLRDPLAAAQGEYIVMFAGIPGHDDLGIGLASMAGKTPGPGLIERHKASRTGEYAFLNLMTSTLLEGPRSIDGMPGDEFAFKARERNLSTGYAFNWETQGTVDNVLRPFVSLELQTGNSLRAGGEPVQSTLSEESLADLWRRMSSSLRLRPVEQPVVADADLQPGLALGTLAWAGNTCQQTGWWQCGQADANLGVFGGERQFLREGQVIPQALLLPKPTVWQKVRGLQPSYEASTPTNWRLADKRSAGRQVVAAGLAQPLLPKVENRGKLALVARGLTLRSGAICPASGWWRCMDDQALDKTRWFASAIALPAATYLLGRTGPHRRFPAQHLLQRQAAWQLMRVAEAQTLAPTAMSDGANCEHPIETPEIV